MPIVTAKTDQGRISQTAQTESAWINPTKKIIQAQTVSAPSHVDKLVEQKTNPQQESVQTSISADTKEAPKETSATKAVTLSPQLTALARKEAKVRQQEQALKAERDAFAAEKAEVEKLKELKAKLANKDYSALDSLGVTYQGWTDALLKTEETRSPQDEAIESLRTELSQIKEDQKKQVDRLYQATIGEYKNEISKLVTSNPDFSTIKEQNAQDHVLQHIIDTFEQDGETLSVEQASKEVEEALLEDALAALKLSKVKSKIATPTTEKKPLPPPTVKTASKTITNRVATGATSAQPPVETGKMQHLTPKQRIELAIRKAQRT